MNSRDPLEIELLVPAYLRRASVADHQAFRESMVQPKPLDPIDEADPLLTKSEAAGILRVCGRTLNEHIRHRRIAFCKIGRTVRIRRSALDAFILSTEKPAL